MATGEVEVAGFAQLQTALLTFAPKMQAKVMRGALAAGARVVRNQARANVPTAPPNSHNAALYNSVTGGVKKSLRVSSRVDTKTGMVKARVVAGSYDAYYARWVEFGTK